MINFDEIKRQMLPIINSEDVYVILDVDRTIINGTSWYYACKYADLLISKKNIKDFIRFNDMAYGENSLSLESFREKTLNLITSTYSKEFIKLMKSVREVDYTFKEGLEIDQLKLYFSGIFISRELTVYSDVVRYIKYMHRFFGSRLKLIFLSSGYQEFIRGVVDGIFKNNFDENIDYSVIGSEVDIINGKLREVYFMSQKNKQKIVEALIENGANIELLADDSSENPELFECVLNNGGKALQIDYAKGQSLSKVWSEFCESFDSNSLKNHLMFEDIRNKICKVNMKNDYMDFLSNKTNEIGIFTLTYGEYVEALCYLLDSINLEKGNEIESLLSQMFMIKNDVVHLRGKLYYYWVPQYVFLDTRDIIEGYLELLRVVKKLLGELSECKLIDRHINNYYVRTIMISILEHLQHALLICLNTIELASISEESTPVVDFGLRDIIQLTTDLIFGCIEGNSINEDVYNLIQSLNEDILVRWMNDYKMYHKGMRELDNIVSIYKSVKSIIDNERFNSIDYVISFAYGGISLGYSLVSYLKVNNVRKLFPIIINCHYSSKNNNVITNRNQFITMVIGCIDISHNTTMNI
ncbi:hypothetical protein [Bacillus sp. XF8]|uniref:hypothetical protein n=1 Tax=Bacillus sp. XF8 TaxID=2819289 RepID=UPI001AA0755F|nr:hypothetical protein [Bacillus sp. XF8]MBO1582886.1 hypothetical protein [Bacillus sp. XF8]